MAKAQEQAGGWLPRKAIEAVAAQLDMPDIRVMEVATFYTMFNLEPVGKYFIQFCGTTPCVLRGAGDIKKSARAAHRRAEPRHRPDGKFSWLEVECLGACSNAPMVQINDDYYEDLTTENFEKLLDDLAAGRPVKAGSADRPHHASEPFEARQHAARTRHFTTAPSSAHGASASRSRRKAETGEAAGRRRQRARRRPRPPSRHAGRAIESEAADTPAKRAKEGERPISRTDQKEAADPSKATKVEPRGCRRAAGSAERQVLRGDASKKEGEAVPASPTTPEAGTPPRKPKPAATAAKASRA